MKDLTTKIIQALLLHYQEKLGVEVVFQMSSSGWCKIVKFETGHDVRVFDNMEAVYEDIKELVFPSLDSSERIELIAHEMGHGFLYKHIVHLAKGYQSLLNVKNKMGKTYD